MLTEVMRFYGLARPPVDAGFFETEHHAQVSRDIRAAIMGGRLIALTAVSAISRPPMIAARMSRDTWAWCSVSKKPASTGGRARL